MSDARLKADIGHVLLFWVALAPRRTRDELRRGSMLLLFFFKAWIPAYAGMTKK